MRRILVILVAFIAASITPPTFAVNRVLNLDGDGDYVEVPDADSLDLIDNFTFEVWVFPIATSGENMIFNKENTYQWAIIDGNLQWALETNVKWYWHDTGIPMPVNQWAHLALTYDSKNVSVYRNGILLSTIPQGGKLSVNDSALRIGARSQVVRNWPSSLYPPPAFFAGQIDEVRLFNYTRTQEEIQKTMHTTLSGREPGLVGYWRFDDKKNIVTDSSESHSDGKLIGDAHFVEAKLPDSSELVMPTVISGKISDEDGKPIQYTSVRLEQDDEDIAQTKTDTQGNYWIVISQKVSGSYDLSATRRDKGNWQFDINLREGEHRTLNLMLKEAISIEGRLSMADDTTPPRSILEATRNGKVVAATSSREDGQYRFINLKPGQYQVRCYIPDEEYVYYSEGKDKPVVDAQDATYLQVERDKTIGNIDFHLEKGGKRVNRVLNLDGDGDYVEIMDSESLNNINSRVTMEAWIKPTAFTNQYMPIIYKGEKRLPSRGNRSYTLWLHRYGNLLHLASAPSGEGQMTINSPTNLIALNTWYHIACVIDARSGMMKMLINGSEIARGDFGKDIRVASLPLRIGWTHEEDFTGFSPFAGQIDDVRIWNIARTPEEIKTKMHTTLSGKEPGLVGYWRFDDEGKVATDSSPNHNAGKLIGDAHVVEAKLPQPSELVVHTVLSGVIMDEAGKPIPNASVRLEQDGEEIAKTQANGSGNYRIVVYPSRGLYDISVSSGEKGVWQLGIRLHEGERRTLNLTLKESISISGTLLMLDEVTPHVACVVQAVRPRPNGEGEPTVIATTLTDENGKYQFINLKPATYQVRCYTLNGYVYHQEGKHLAVENGKSLTNTDFHLAPFKKGTWRTYTTFDGLLENYVTGIHQDAEGFMWFSSYGGGVARYDGQEFETFTTADGLVSNHVKVIYGDTNGHIWFGTGDGISRYDGKGFVNFTTEDGLGHNDVVFIHQDAHGRMWFATLGGGVSYYDGKEFTTFTTDDGLADNRVNSIGENADGVLWFGTMGGVQRYALSASAQADGESFVAVNQLGPSLVLAIHQARDGAMWFGTWSDGVFRYDGQKFVNFITADGLAHSTVGVIYEASDGNLWFGTGWPGQRGNGISCYDGENFVNFTTADGLVSHSFVHAIYEEASGVMWFGTDRGISQYAPRRASSFTRQDGLAHNKVNTIYREADGTMWFGTDGGLCRYEDIRRGTHHNGVEFITVTSSGGERQNQVRAIYGEMSDTPNDGQTSAETLWLGTGNGVWRYDGTAVVPVFRGNDIGYNPVNDIQRDADGNLWIATGLGNTVGGGVFRYDGKHLVNFTEKDGLAGDDVSDLYRAADGAMWFGTDNGISRYNDTGFVNFTREDKGRVYQFIRCIYGAPDRRLWLGGEGDVSVYNDQQWVTLSPQILLTQVNALYQTTDGQMWFGTARGVVHSDETAWTVLDTRDGLVDDIIHSIFGDETGALWFATDQGVTRYLPNRIAPKVRLISVKTDVVYTELKQIPPITTGNRVTIKYSAIDFVTIPEKRQYRVRIKETDSGWRKPTKSPFFDHTFKKSGIYTFQVQAIDQDLNYSEPASLMLKVVPPWYLNGWIAIPSGGGIFALLVGFIILGYRYYIQRRESQRLRDQMLEQERNARETLEAKNVQLEEAKTEAETAREAAEAAKDEAITANRAKSVFLANMSHEIRTPMNAVLGYAQILQRDSELLPRQRDAVDTIENSGNHLLALINDVLDISKIEAGRLELQETDFDLNALITGISAMFQIRCEREGLTWQVEGLEDTVLVRGDEGKLRQILINLLGNAVKFTESGGVTLNVVPEADDAYRFEVRDTGVGIPPEAQAKIFEPFQQSEEGAKKGGTGLGLAISKRQIELMGGELSLESEVGVGSNFFFTLPLSPLRDDTTSDVLDQSAQYSGVRRLAEGYDITALIADDTKINRDVLSKMLTDIGAEVMEAENGQQAVEMARSHHPDIVFMDIRMPVMDGIEATRQLFDEFDKGQLKIVAISASALRHEEEEYFEAGFDDFIGKPFRFERLYECLANVLSVEFEYAEPVGDESEETPEIDLTKVVLPEELLSRLKDATEIYSLTQLNQCLDEMAQLDEYCGLLAEQLRALGRNQEMDAILDILSEIET